uniref:Uncharacterized protein n=1 Tax=Steinernema glaseri TaxID=37863 RepID=A0A1I7YWQ3_9BILA
MGLTIHTGTFHNTPRQLDQLVKYAEYTHRCSMTTTSDHKPGLSRPHEHNDSENVIVSYLLLESVVSAFDNSVTNEQPPTQIGCQDSSSVPCSYGSLVAALSQQNTCCKGAV